MDAMEMEPSKETENSQPTPKKRGRKPKSETKQNTISEPELLSGGPPRTRSKVAPFWTPKESLVLVKVISIIEADCSKYVSSHQKWKMIVEHCVALDLQRTLKQCRGRWSLLVLEYNQIKKWDTKSKTGSFWDLDCEKRKEFQLPENFDKELFQAIDDYARAKRNNADTDLDTDAETEADAETEVEAETHLLSPMAKWGSNRHKRRSISEEIMSGEKPQNISELEQPQELQAKVEPHKSCEEVNPQTCVESETPQVQHSAQELEVLQWESKKSVAKLGDVEMERLRLIQSNDLLGQKVIEEATDRKKVKMEREDEFEQLYLETEKERKRLAPFEKAVCEIRDTLGAQCSSEVLTERSEKEAAHKALREANKKIEKLEKGNVERERKLLGLSEINI